MRIYLFFLFTMLMWQQRVFSQTGIIGANVADPTEVLDINGTIRIRDLPVNNTVGTISTTTTGVAATIAKTENFNAINTVVIDKNGVFGVISGLPVVEIPDIRTISYATSTTLIDNNTRSNSVTVIGNLAVYYDAQSGDTGNRPLRFCLLNNITDNVVVNQLKLGSGGGPWGGNQTFSNISSNPATTLAALQASVVPRDSSDQTIWHLINNQVPEIQNMDYVQYMFSLIDTQEVYRLTAIVNPNITADKSSIFSPARVTFFIERLSNY